jgi:signal transduction histidine kinase
MHITRTTAHWMTARYSLALLIIAVCSLLGFFMTGHVMHEHADMLEVVNISGRQRMLSQRAALLVERLHHAESEPERREHLAQLNAVVETFEQTYRRLIGTGTGAALGSTVRDLYFEGPEPLNGQVLRFIAALHAIIEAADHHLPSDMEAVRFVTTQALGPLLDRLEHMVARYEETGEAEEAMLHRLSVFALGLTLLTLLGEAMLIFRPMVRHVDHQFDEITRMTTALEHSNETLEEQVRTRTAEIDAARAAAEQAHRAKSRFLAHAGHDLKQPLEAIGMFTGMLERQVDTARGRLLLKDLRLAQRSMRNLLDSILEISKLESGAVQPALTAVPLAPLFDQLASELAPQAEAKDLALRVVQTDEIVLTDAALLERILRNLLVNAVRYTERGCVLLGCRRKGNTLWIEVHDSGHGIARSNFRRIFDEFVQLDRPDRDRSQGIGLGLAIVDRLARLLGHAVTVRSIEGRGSVFSVQVPRLRSGASLSNQTVPVHFLDEEDRLGTAPDSQCL